MLPSFGLHPPPPELCVFTSQQPSEPQEPSRQSQSNSQDPAGHPHPEPPPPPALQGPLPSLQLPLQSQKLPGYPHDRPAYSEQQQLSEATKLVFGGHVMVCTLTIWYGQLISASPVSPKPHS